MQLKVFVIPFDLSGVPELFNNTSQSFRPSVQKHHQNGLFSFRSSGILERESQRALTTQIFSFHKREKESVRIFIYLIL